MYIYMQLYMYVYDEPEGRTRNTYIKYLLLRAVHRGVRDEGFLSDVHCADCNEERNIARYVHCADPTLGREWQQSRSVILLLLYDSLLSTNAPLQMQPAQDQDRSPVE